MLYIPYIYCVHLNKMPLETLCVFILFHRVSLRRDMRKVATNLHFPSRSPQNLLGDSSEKLRPPFIFAHHLFCFYSLSTSNVPGDAQPSACHMHIDVYDSRTAEANSAGGRRSRLFKQPHPRHAPAASDNACTCQNQRYPH